MCWGCWIFCKRNRRVESSILFRVAVDWKRKRSSPELSKVRADSFILSCRTVLDCQTVRADSSSVSCISSVSINACWEEKARWPVRRREVRLYRTRGSEKKKWRMQRCSMPPQRRSGFTIFLTACGIHRLRILCAPSKRKILLLSLLFLQLCKSSTIIGRREGFCIRQSGFQYWFAIGFLASGNQYLLISEL